MAYAGRTGTVSSPSGRLVSQSTQKPNWRPIWQSLLAVAWIAAFAACFYQFDLPNSSPKINRMQIWQELPLLLVNAIDPPPPAVGDAETRQLWKHAGWRNLPQRFGMYGVSLWILAAAWAWGHLVLRCCRLTRSLPRLERHFFAMACGLSVISLQVLGLGLASVLSRVAVGSVLTLAIPLEFGLRLIGFTHRTDPLGSDLKRPPSWREFAGQYWPLLGLLPFLMCYIGGAFLPEVDFDVKEYHFGGPKEWYQEGQIHFLPHNVYTSFPFLTEMLTLLGMVLYGDWYWGALAGKGVLMSFSLLTALGLFAAGRRWFTPTVGVWAALIHLSTPWIYRISIIAYAEGGLTFYLFACLYATMLLVDHVRTSSSSPALVNQSDQHTLGSWRGLAILAGLLAGSAMACKYPGAISVVIPIASVIAVTTYRQHRSWHLPLEVFLLFCLGVSLTIGPWLLKNLIETGNPVYPLLYSVFGGTDWNPELNAKWNHAHSPDHHHLTDLGLKLIDVTLKADWLSPLLFGLAPLAFYSHCNRRRTFWLWMYVAYLFATWWLLTHRIDRFWVPLIPIVSLLAAVGIEWNPAKWWRYGMGLAAALAMTFNLAFMTSSLCGYNAYLLDLKIAAEQTARITAPETVLLNSRLPAGAKVLCVGEAELFDARFAYIYNTVFDLSIFEQLAGTEAPEISSRDRPLRSTVEIQRNLKQQGITHVLVNWQEILRYRTTYGYTDFVTPGRFQQLLQMQILEKSWDTPGLQNIERADPAIRAEVDRWGPELILEIDGQRYYKTFEIFPVVQ